jgi:hypothetical protein
MRRKWGTKDGKPPYHAHPFSKWVRGLTKRPAAFSALQADYNVPQATAYKWAAGECLPSGKYLSVYEYFLRCSSEEKVQ